jgi:hypothetical protein
VDGGDVPGLKGPPPPGIRRSGLRMKETEGGVVALDPHYLSTVVLELHRRGAR